MYDIKVLVCLVVVHTVWVSSRSCDCNYNLSEIFRTPKDFSRVNFDHLEILERNNFGSDEASNTVSSAVANNDISKQSELGPRAAVANAQVMLRFGGDDINGRNRIDKEGIPEPHAPHHRVVHYYHPNDVHRYPPYVPYLPPREEYLPPPPPLPMPHPPVLSYPPPHSQYFYSMPPPPYSFPRYYYSYPEHRPVDQNLDKPAYEGYTGRLVPVEEESDSQSQAASVSSAEEKDFLDYRSEKSTTPEIVNQDRPQILETMDLSNDTIPETVCASYGKKDIEESTASGDIPKGTGPDPENLEIEVVDMTEGGVVEEVQVPVEEAAEEVPVEKLAEENDAAHENVVEEMNTNQENIVEEKVNNTNADIEIMPNTPPPNATADPTEPPNGTNGDWLNSSLVEYQCPVCGHKPKLLVSYPTTNKKDTDSDLTVNKIVQFSTCPCQRCTCNNCYRNPNIPYGKRFAKDIDSLLSVKLPKPVVIKPLVQYQAKPYSTGYSASSSSSVVAGFSQVGNQKPKVYVDGHSTTSGSGFYADPARAAVYRHPTVVEIIRTPDPFRRVIQSPPYLQYYREPEPPRVVEFLRAPGPPRFLPVPEPPRFLPVPEPPRFMSIPVPRLEPPRIVEFVRAPEPQRVVSAPSPRQQYDRALEPESPTPAPGPNLDDPHLYKVVPKYDIHPVNIKPLKVPDLQPTSHFVCHVCNQPHDPKVMCYREFAPKYDHVSYAPKEIPVSTIIESKEGFLHDGPPGQPKAPEPINRQVEIIPSVNPPVSVIRVMGPPRMIGERRY